MNYRNLFVGIDNKVTLANGTTVVPVNFDNGATTPPMKCAVEAIYHDLPWYGAIGRSNGQKNRYCTERFNAARNEILRFFHLEANILSSDAGIATRDGKFCAHPYVTRLLGIPHFPYNKEEQDECGMVRLSLGLYNTREEADRVLAFIYDLSRNM